MRLLPVGGMAIAMLCGCDQPDLADQPRVDTYEVTAAFPNGQAARPVPDGTMSREDPIRPMAGRNPLPVTRDTLRRGQQQFDIYCAPCHGRNGYGQGVIVQRGFPAPPSYHTIRLREADDSHFYAAITDGYGVMYSYASRLPPRDRWAVIAYIRALQLSQNARPDDVPPSVEMPDDTPPPQVEP